MWEAMLLGTIGVLVSLSHAQIPSTMLAVHANTMNGCGPPDFGCITTETVKVPKPILGQVLVKVNSSSVNPSDVDVELKLGSLFGVLGVDFAGTVVEVGPGVKSLKVGDPVWGYTKGAYAEYAIAFEALTSLRPKLLPVNDAGTVPEVGTTSLEALKKLRAPWDKASNKTVVITSGSGGTGFIGIQLAKALGAGYIITATSGANNIAFVKSLGADLVIDYKVEEIFDALSNNSVDFVYDNYGAPGTADKAMPKIRPGGAFLLLPGGEDGKLSKHPKPGVQQIDFGDMVPSKKNLEQLTAMFDAGQLVTHIDSRFTLSSAAQAFARSRTGEVVGKIAINV